MATRSFRVKSYKIEDVVFSRDVTSTLSNLVSIPEDIKYVGRSKEPCQVKVVPTFDTENFTQYKILFTRPNYKNIQLKLYDLVTKKLTDYVPLSNKVPFIHFAQATLKMYILRKQFYLNFVSLKSKTLKLSMPMCARIQSTLTVTCRTATDKTTYQTPQKSVTSTRVKNDLIALIY